jgi:hypothetical protein
MLKVRQLCKEHGFYFQVIDLRCDVHDEATLDYYYTTALWSNTMNIVY